MPRTLARTATIAIASLASALAGLTLTVSFAPVQAAPAITDFSSQPGFDPKNKARPGQGFKNPNVVPRNIAPRNLQVPRNPNAGFRGPVGVPGPNNAFRGPGPGFRGPAMGFRGPIGAVPFRGARANFIRGPHRFFRNGRYIPFVALGAIGAITIGSRYYTPYAYVDGPGADACVGQTDDGMCELRMTEVPLEDGTAVMQCVSYCPQ